jgi:signal transduction histidine kinase
MTRRLLLSYVSLTLLILMGFGTSLGITYASDQRQRTQRLFEREAAVLADLVEDDIRLQDYADLPRLADEYARLSAGRVLIIDRQAKVLASSPESTTSALSDGEQRDLMTALAGGRASNMRDSAAQHAEVFSIAVPTATGGTTLGAVHMSVPADEVADAVGRVVVALIVGALAILACVAGIGVALARWTTRPIRALEDATDQLARGVLDMPAATDIGPPELRRLAATFNHTAKRLQLLVDQQRGFAADASHQLRTPLTALRLRLENLEPDLAAAGQHNLDAALGEIDRLADMVEQLLSLARLEEEGVTPVEVDLDDIVAGRVANWTALAGEQGVQISVAGVPPGTVLAIPGALEQVLDNLLSNALKVAPRGSTVTINRRRLDRPGRPAVVGDVLLHVTDQGPGMTAEQRRLAFNRFWREPGASKGGSGLGLAIVSRLVQASGAHITLDDAPGGGLDAVIALRPVRAEPMLSRLGLYRARHSRQGTRERTPVGAAR